MKEFCVLLGKLLIVVAMFAIPILYTCSFALGWDLEVIFLLSLLTAMDFIGFWECVDDEVVKK